MDDISRELPPDSTGATPVSERKKGPEELVRFERGLVDEAVDGGPSYEHAPAAGNRISRDGISEDEIAHGGGSDGDPVDDGPGGNRLEGLGPVGPSQPEMSASDETTRDGDEVVSGEAGFVQPRPDAEAAPEQVETEPVETEASSGDEVVAPHGSPAVDPPSGQADAGIAEADGEAAHADLPDAEESNADAEAARDEMAEQGADDPSDGDAEHDSSEEVDAKDVDAEHTDSGEAESEHAESEHAESEDVDSGDADSGDADSGDADAGDVDSDEAMAAVERESREASVGADDEDLGDAELGEDGLPIVPELDDAAAVARIVYVLMLTSREGMSLFRLAQACNTSQKLVEEALALLQEQLRGADLPVELTRVGDTVRWMSGAAAFPYLQRLRGVKKLEKLSPAALETLAVIAYQQPVMRSEIESIRGVKAGPMLRTLLQHKLVRCTGRADVPGRPLQYGTTQHFLERFGLASLDDLPSVKEWKSLG